MRLCGILYKVHGVRSGSAVLGSIPIGFAAPGAFAILVIFRIVSLKLAAICPIDNVKRSKKGASMNNKVMRSTLGSIFETAWALGVSVTAGSLFVT